MSFIFGDNLQDEAAKKEEAKINRMRQMQEERRDRIFNVRDRTIGVDVTALNAQAQQNQRQKEIEKERIRLEKLKLLEMEKVLASREEDEIKLRHEETKKLKDSWNESMNAKLAERSASKESKNVPIHTSLSGAQPMAGEDLEQNQRVKFQQAQMRSNIAKSLGELDDAKKQQQLIELSYAQMDQYLYEMRTKAEIDEQNARRQTNIHIREENTQCARRNEVLRQTDISAGLSSDERIKTTSLDLFNEDRTQAVSSDGRVIKGREDRFKGLPNAAIQKIHQENATVVQEKNAALLRLQQEDREWAHQQQLVKSHLDSTFDEKVAARRQALQKQAYYLQKQAEEQALSHVLQQQDKFGKIDGGYYSNFGKSCR